MKQTRQEELTKFFGEVVAEVNQTLSNSEIDDDLMWKLARRMHTVWREALKRLHAEESGRTRQPGESHPAFNELMRMVRAEVKS